ncbi:PDZ domain-containing protein 9 [Hemicordylus capensis]|uniref:PDZ domain-containing protein 9 n=1 Tax=Hemicordylus capensis TaxID=884348 RepID=UPI002303E807|nr:PDZ domain-containing protein 9 [Hemicordylus capensis]
MAYRRESVRRPSASRRESASPQTSFRRPPSRRQSSFRRKPTRRESSSRRQSTGSQPSSSKSPYDSFEEGATSYIDSEDYDSDNDGDEEDEPSEMEESEHTLSTTVKTNIQVEEDGIGFILIQNGFYLQISSLVDNSAAAKDGKLQQGDVLLKIGHANVLGWTLRELRQLLHTTPVGTVLQIQVYRDFVMLPSRWAHVVEQIPEKKGPEICISSETSEEDWTSSEGSDEGAVGNAAVTGGSTAAPGDGATVPGSDSHLVFGEEDEDDSAGPKATVTAATPGRTVHSSTVGSKSFVFGPPHQPKWISKDWHIFERKTHTFTVGLDIGCDIMVHGCEDEGNHGISSGHSRSPSPYWTVSKDITELMSTSTSSSVVSDVFWLDTLAYEME